MKIRTVVVTAGLCVTVLTAGCASSVAGQAEIASGASLPATSTSAPSPFPDPSSGGSSSSDDPTSPTTDSTDGTDSTDSTDSSDTLDPATTAGTDSTDSTDSTEDTGSTGSTDVTENTPTPATGSDDSSVGPTSATSIPGLSKDCNAVLAGITAFSDLLQRAGENEKISQATVDEALKQLPASGLPARPQADIVILRTAVSGAAGKTLSELAQTMTDGKVVAALQDLSTWAQDNCM